MVRCNNDKPVSVGQVGSTGVYQTFNEPAYAAGLAIRGPAAGLVVNELRVSYGSDPEPGPAATVMTEEADRLTRGLDVVIALAAILFFAPLLFIIAMMIKASGGPVLFRHQRIGRGGVTFSCLKFRTMHVNSEELLQRVLADDPDAWNEWQRDHKLRNDPRILPGAAIIRKLSLDELPQLFNVLGGSMSIVGPRPIVQAESLRYGRYFREYCQVRPGLTGLWQVSGRNATTYRRRVACDVAYVRSRSPLKNAQIMMKTIPAVCLARGAY